MTVRNPLLLQALRGPVLLVTFGILAALHQFSQVPFQRTWPVLIIVYGLMKLLERTTRPSPEAPLPPGGGFAS